MAKTVLETWEIPSTRVYKNRDGAETRTEQKSVKVELYDLSGSTKTIRVIGFVGGPTGHEAYNVEDVLAQEQLTPRSPEDRFYICAGTNGGSWPSEYISGEDWTTILRGVGESIDQETRRKTENYLKQSSDAAEMDRLTNAVWLQEPGASPGPHGSIDTVAAKADDLKGRMAALGARTEIVAQIARERIRQIGMWGYDKHTPEEWLVILAKQMGFASNGLIQEWSNPEASPGAGLEAYRERLGKLAAVAVAAMEDYDLTMASMLETATTDAERNESAIKQGLVSTRRFFNHASQRPTLLTRSFVGGHERVYYGERSYIALAYLRDRMASPAAQGRDRISLDSNEGVIVDFTELRNWLNEFDKPL